MPVLICTHLAMLCAAAGAKSSAEKRRRPLLQLWQCVCSAMAPQPSLVHCVSTKQSAQRFSRQNQDALQPSTRSTMPEKQHSNCGPSDGNDPGHTLDEQNRRRSEDGSSRRLSQWCRSCSSSSSMFIMAMTFVVVSACSLLMCSPGPAVHWQQMSE
jgi:hypothetical protein